MQTSLHMTNFSRSANFHTKYVGTPFTFVRQLNSYFAFSLHCLQLCNYDLYKLHAKPPYFHILPCIKICQLKKTCKTTFWECKWETAFRRRHKILDSKQAAANEAIFSTSFFHLLFHGSFLFFVGKQTATHLKSVRRKDDCCHNLIRSNGKVSVFILRLIFSKNEQAAKAWPHV